MATKSAGQGPKRHRQNPWFLLEQPRSATENQNEFAVLIPGYMLRHWVKLGVTGWAQIHGWRGETDTIEKVARRIQYDLWYIRRWSLWLDFWIVGRTVLQVTGDENAY